MHFDFTFLKYMTVNYMRNEFQKTDKQTDRQVPITSERECVWNGRDQLPSWRLKTGQDCVCVGPVG